MKSLLQEIAYGKYDHLFSEVKMHPNLTSDQKLPHKGMEFLDAVKSPLFYRPHFFYAVAGRLEGLPLFLRPEWVSGKLTMAGAKNYLPCVTRVRKNPLIGCKLYAPPSYTVFHMPHQIVSVPWAMVLTPFADCIRWSS